ncbi:fasciclin-like arabinogalactan protein 12 [Olea europaea var. sylvestris]|uniref:fasciclin-like arabinogalactan protein 12 n=1 Tax=Olea europaea var. sylvestris TaxID=158386 RepID=UPI000C1D7847|nr:fasciclin-like arabinogalactan protein 12 [Olea europaea var. sylvestris]
MKQIFSTLPLVFFLFFFQCTPAFSQSLAPAPTPPVLAPPPPTPAPVPPPPALVPTAVVPALSGPTNINAILQKAKQYTTLIRLLKSTQIGDQINSRLDNSNQGFTIFAPTDSAFSNLKPGMLNSLTDQQKIDLILFHVLPSFFSVSQFQTASNPLRTQAGTEEQFPLNVIATGNQVNITSDMVNTTVASTVYADKQLAVYEVDKVLLPKGLFVPPPPAPAPLKPKKLPASNSSDADDITTPVN